MPSIDEINQAAFLNRQLDIYNWAIAILNSGAGAITTMTVVAKITEGVAPPQPPIVNLNLMPPIDDQNVMNVTAEAFQMAANEIIQKLTEMGFTPSTPEGQKTKQTVPAWMVPMGPMSGTRGGAYPNDPLRYTSPAPPPNLSIFPYQNLSATTPPPPQPIDPQYPVNQPPPPEYNNPAEPPPSVDEGQPPSEFPETPPAPQEPDTPPSEPPRP